MLDRAWCYTVAAIVRTQIHKETHSHGCKQTALRNAYTHARCGPNPHSNVGSMLEYGRGPRYCRKQAGATHRQADTHKRVGKASRRTHTRAIVHTCMHTQTHTNTCMHTFMRAYIHTCMHVYHTYTYTCIQTYTYTFTHASGVGRAGIAQPPPPSPAHPTRARRCVPPNLLQSTRTRAPGTHLVPPHMAVHEHMQRNVRRLGRRKLAQMGRCAAGAGPMGRGLRTGRRLVGAGLGTGQNPRGGEGGGVANDGVHGDARTRVTLRVCERGRGS